VAAWVRPPSGLESGQTIDRAALWVEAHEQGITAMADHDMKRAEQTYHGFLSWTKTGIIISAAVTVLVVILIAS
jgi:Bacterial aa3 type cytochrome c oxidase subunit IV